jgi:hypothetical protein
MTSFAPLNPGPIAVNKSCQDSTKKLQNFDIANADIKQSCMLIVCLLTALGMFAKTCRTTSRSPGIESVFFSFECGLRFIIESLNLFNEKFRIL